MIRIGVVALQGDVAEHQEMLGKLGVEPVLVRDVSQLQTLDGLIIPGGETTAVGLFFTKTGLDKAIKKMANEGLPVWGTCMGAILIGKKIVDNKLKLPSLGLLDIKIRRNAYGRQSESFEQSIPIAALSGEAYPCVFIRAPWIEDAGKHVSILAQFQGKPILVEENNIMASTFHPELTKDTRLHEYFIGIVRKRGASN